MSTIAWEGRTAADWLAEWRHNAGIELPRLLLFEQVASTNDVARSLAESGAVAGTTVIADLQTHGRGRGGKSWHAPAGTALLLSILLRPSGPLAADDAPGATPLRIGLAAARALDRCTGTRIQVKWPNDLQLDGAKVAGILCEAALATAQGGFVVAGIGVNVNQQRDELPEHGPASASTAQPATSLRLATGRSWDRGLLAGAIVAEIMAIGDRIVAPLTAAELAELKARDPLGGHDITIDGDPAGRANGIAPDGALRITGRNGQTTNLRHGTVRIAPLDRRTTMD
jgi:BirA family biotin operon repressor/biotin-[acetyl-CoA-carboxylase] ligase